MTREKIRGLLPDALRVTLIAGVPLTLAFGEPEGAVLVALASFTAVVARFVGGREDFQLLFVGALTVTAYVIGFGGVAGPIGDSLIAHTLLPAAVAPIVLSGALRTGAVTFPARSGPARLAVIVVGAALTIALGAVWELVEAVSDAWLGTHMAISYGDTVRDLACNTVGAVAGSVFAVSRLGR